MTTAPESARSARRKSVLELARPEIVALAAYQPARWEPELTRLHANEMPWRSAGDRSEAGLNRYPEPYHDELDARLAALYGVQRGCALATRGSDEAIDLLMRCFCRAGQDSIVVCPPTFGMYATAARIQGAAVHTVPLVRERGYAVDPWAVLARCTADVKLVFLCSPNNPTGNLLELADVLRIARELEGRAVVVLDEAYLEFTTRESLAARVSDLPHVVVLRTCSKAYALAGARVGTMLADRAVIDLARKVLPPYALSQPAIEAAFEAFTEPALGASHERIAAIVAERNRVATALGHARDVVQVWPSDANFLLVELQDPSRALAAAREAGLLVRDVRSQPGLERALRLTVGAPDQNDRLLRSLS